MASKHHTTRPRTLVVEDVSTCDPFYNIRYLQDLVSILEDGGVQLYPVLIPLIQHSTNVNARDSVYMLDEGLNLWRKVIQRAPAPTDELCSLFPSIVISVAAKDLSPPIAKSLCRVSEDYMLLLLATTQRPISMDSVLSTTLQLLDTLLVQGTVILPAMRTLLRVVQILPMVTGGQLPGPPLDTILFTILEKILFRIVVFTSQVGASFFYVNQINYSRHFFIGNRSDAIPVLQRICATPVTAARLFRRILYANRSEGTREEFSWRDD